MSLVSEILLFVFSLSNAFDHLMPPLRDGSKYAFTRAPYFKPVIVHKELIQDEVVIRWPNGIVKYYVDYECYDKNIDTAINREIELIQTRSCIQFNKMRSKPGENVTWIHITNPNKERECNHGPRYLDSGEIILVLGYDCIKPKEILHTLLHGIGFKDEVTHPHRDKYIRVLWNNIQPAYHYLYRKQTMKSSKTIVEYDPLSVMQFHDRAFSRNGRATIAPVEPGLLISPSETLSQLDEMSLQMYFNHECNKRKVSKLIDSCKMVFKQDQKMNYTAAEQNDSNSKEQTKNEPEATETLTVLKEIRNSTESQNSVEADSRMNVIGNKELAGSETQYSDNNSEELNDQKVISENNKLPSDDTSNDN